MGDLDSHAKRALRVAVCDAAGGQCAYCGAHVGRRGTLDHYLPQALGGSNDRANLRWACIGCNGAKADMPPAEWEQRQPERAVSQPSRRQVRIGLLQLIAQRARMWEWSA